MDAIGAAFEKLIADQTWANFIGFFSVVIKTIFGFVATEEDIPYEA